MKRNPRNKNGINGNGQGRHVRGPGGPAGPPPNAAGAPDDRVAAILKLLAENRRAWRVAAKSAMMRRMCLLGFGTAVALTGIITGYLVYVIHPSASVTGAIVRSPLLLFIEGLAFLFFRESRRDHEDARQSTTEADHASRLLGQCLLLLEFGDPEDLVAFSGTLGVQVRRQHEYPQNRNRGRKKPNLPDVHNNEFEGGIQ
jgi:hypothetical protein